MATGRGTETVPAKLPELVPFRIGDAPCSEGSSRQFFESSGPALLKAKVVLGRPSLEKASHIESEIEVVRTDIALDVCAFGQDSGLGPVTSGKMPP